MGVPKRELKQKGSERILEKMMTKHSQTWKQTFICMSKKIKEAVSIPVLVTGGVETVEQAEHLIEDGAADLVGVGRALLKDPCWTGK